MAIVTVMEISAREEAARNSEKNDLESQKEEPEPLKKDGKETTLDDSSCSGFSHFC